MKLLSSAAPSINFTASAGWILPRSGFCFWVRARPLCSEADATVLPSGENSTTWTEPECTCVPQYIARGGTLQVREGQALVRVSNRVDQFEPCFSTKESTTNMF